MSSQDGTPVGLDFNNDGTKMFVAGWDHDDINEYTLVSPFNLVDVAGVNSGDVIHTSSTDNYDTDADSDTLTVTSVRTGSSEGSGTAGTVGAALTGTYGQLTLNANGSYTYVANQSAADALDPGDIVTDSFNYTVSDGNGGTDIAVIQITVIGINDAPVAVNDTDAVNEDATITESSGSELLIADDTDADDSSSLTVTQIAVTGGSNSSVSSGSSYNSSGTQVTGTYGTLTVGADGTYTYVADQSAADALDASDTVTDSFTYTVSDGNGGTDTATLIITVTGVNDAPVGVADTGYIKEGGTLTVTDGGSAVSGTSTGSNTGDITDNDTDADASSSATITSITATTAGGSAQTTFSSNSETVTGQYGTLTINSNGSYSYVANSNISGLDAGDSNITDVFTYIVSDGTATSTTTLTINIIASQDVTARNDTGTVNEDATLTVDNGDNATSVTAATYDTSPFSVASQDGGMRELAFSSDGTKFFVLGFQNRCVNEYHMTTAFDVSTATFDSSFNVSGQEVYPHGLAFNTDGTKMFVSGYAGHDVNEYTLSTAFDVSTASFVDSFSISSQDTQVRGLAFSNDGTKMFITGNTGDTLEEYTLTTGYDVSTASHTDSMDISSYDNEPRGIAFNSDGTRMFFHGQQNDQIHEFTLGTAYDISTSTYIGANSLGFFDTGAEAIVFNKDGSKLFVSGNDGNTVDEYSLTSPFSLYNVSGENTGDVIDTSSTDNYDTDPDSDTLTVTAIRTGSSEGSGTAGSVGSALTGTYGQLTIAANGSYTYVANQDLADALDPGDVVTDTFNYTVSDGQGETDIAVLTITIIGINDAPVADDETNSVSHSSTLTVTDGTSDVLHGDTDVDASASLTVTGIRTGQEGGSGTAGTVGASLTGSYGTLTIAADGTYTYVANSSAGTDYFTYTVSDGNGGTDTGQITITVGGNSAPVADNETNSVNEDGTVTVTDGTSDVLHGDTDADGDTLTVTQIAVTGGSNSSVSSGSSYNSSGTSVTGTYGTLTIGADGTYTYVADQSASDDLDASDTVTDSFTYTVSDGNGGTDTATLIFTITGINDAPVAVNDTDSVNEDATVTQSSGSGLLMADDSDADDDDSFTVTQIAVTGSSNSAVSSGSSYNSSGTSVTGTYGTLTVGADGTYTYVADQSAADDLDASDTVTDSFTYTISDGDATDTATLIITITGVNDIPTASDKTVTTAEDTPYVFSTSDFGYTDADDDDTLVSITITTLEDAGALQYYDGSSWQDVTLNQVITATDISNNYLRLNPASNENGSPYTTFEFTVNDGDASSATPNTITVNVTPVNDDPVADNETNSVNEDATVTVTDGTSDILHGDTDADSDTLTVTQIAVTGGSNSSVASGSAYNSNGTSVTGTYGTLTVGADGTYTYVADQSASDALDAGDTVTDSFTYTVSDGNGGTDTATLIFTITGVNDRPTAGNETIYINENNTDASFGARTSQNITHTFADSDFTNYSDADADDGVGIRIKSLPTGTLSKISNGAVQSVNDYITNMSNLKYTPPANSEADDSFNYRAYDGSLVGSNERTITISVNAAPVAVNDTGSITAGDADATGNVLSNDTDSDDANSVLRIRGVGAVPESSTMLGNANVGSAVTGTYGSLTIYNKGGYTYSVSGNANTVALGAGETATDVFSYKVMDDETNAGSKAIDIGTITFTITGIDGDAIGEPDPDEPPKIKEKKKDKQQKREERKEKKRLKREKRLERKEFKIPKSNLEKNAEFNQGLKLIDLVAES
ncbi:Ig-like domain-containing protein, partial [Candidatus Pelagibacter sp.]|nr:Ig-like domain-containing protein [Candidatus Pelagibacter sp.]